MERRNDMFVSMNDAGVGLRYANDVGDVSAAVALLALQLL